MTRNDINKKIGKSVTAEVESFNDESVSDIHNSQRTAGGVQLYRSAALLSEIYLPMMAEASAKADPEFAPAMLQAVDLILTLQRRADQIIQGEESEQAREGGSNEQQG